MIGRFSHVAICVRDIDRSIAFYERLGFKAFFDFTQKDPIGGEVVGVDAREVRMVFMRMGDDPHAPFIDIVQFVDPPAEGSAYSALNNVGIGRIAFAVDDMDATYAHLQAMEVDFVTPLKRFRSPEGDDMAMVCFRDPDGIFLEVISGLNVQKD